MPLLRRAILDCCASQDTFKRSFPLFMLQPLLMPSGLDARTFSSSGKSASLTTALCTVEVLFDKRENFTSFIDFAYPNLYQNTRKICKNINAPPVCCDIRVPIEQKGYDSLEFELADLRAGMAVHVRKRV